MSDEFGTVNVRRGDRAREIEVIRQHYRAHRDALTKMMGDAPTEHLAEEYQRLVHEIDTALAKLDELEVRPATAPNVPAAGVMPPERLRTEPGTRPLVAPPTSAPLPDVGVYEPPLEEPQSSSRVLLIVVIGVVVLGVIGWLIWRASDRGATKPIVEAPGATATQPITDTAAVETGTVVPATPAPAPSTPAASASGAVRITPALQDYGTIRKGTRAVRQFEVTNTTAAPVALSVARSQCKCLYYEYASPLAANKKGTITVTVDGARAKAGDLRETLAVTTKNNPTPLGQLEISATIK